MIGAPWEKEWNGICACGKAAMDGIRCRLGATHQPRVTLPWAVQEPKQEKLPWE